MHALIIANGTPIEKDLLEDLIKKSDLIICSDGGANYAHSLQIKPDVIIGDFDSIHPLTRLFFSDVRQIEISDQNTTDLEKVITFCIQEKIDSIDIVGAFGKRLDHTIINLGCIKKFGKRINIRMLDSFAEVTLIHKEIHLSTVIGEKLSLIPLERCTGVTTKNLKYELNDESLELGVRDGISNEAISKDVSIFVENGTLLLYRYKGQNYD